MIKMRAKMITVGLLGAAAIVPIDFAKAAQVGDASWYSLPENITANGEQMDPGELTAAHRSLPFGTRVLVENLSNGRSVVVRINDRGPFVGGRIIDLSKAAAASIGMVDAGTAKVRVTTEDGGILADLGQRTASAKDGAADADSPSSESSDKEPKAEDKAAVAPLKPAPLKSAVNVAKAEAKAATGSVKEAKITKRAAKTKGVTVAASAAKTHQGVHKAVRIASAAKPSKTRTMATASIAKKHEGAQKTVRVAASKPSKPSRVVNARVHLASACNGIRVAGRHASNCSSRRMTVASNATRSNAVLGATSGLSKAGRTRDRRVG
jgi:rare lipoprotein A